MPSKTTPKTLSPSYSNPCIFRDISQSDRFSNPFL
uniref:Uncharacterized protein n=1 Tax=Anguilla anguilla TaxID=7936 RepID=A0A0E9QH51_ANGAN